MLKIDANINFNICPALNQNIEKITIGTFQNINDANEFPALSTVCIIGESQEIENHVNNV